MPKMSQLILFTTFFALSVLNISGSVSAAGFNQLVVFGDSTLDTGYFRYHLSGNPAYDNALAHAITQGATGGYAGNGVMNTIILGQKFGLTATPVGVPGGGTNYANGGATTVINHQSMVPNNVSTILQIQNYLASVNGIADPKTLYLIKSGDNDVTFVTNQTPAWNAMNPNYLRDGAVGLAEAVARLQAAGARTIMVRNSYDSALFAARGGDINPVNASAYALARAVGVWQWSNMAARGVRFIPADNDSLFRFIAHNPTLFGFTADSVLAANAPFANPHVSASFAILTPAQQQSYLFIDGVHLTTAGQTIESDYSYSLLIAPSQISLLAENAVQDGLLRASSIQGQIDLSAKHRGPRGINVWASTGMNRTKIKNETGFPTDSGTPFSGTVGLDYRTSGGVMLGAAFTIGTQKQDFSTGGHFDQTVGAPSLYVAYKTGPVWGDAVATYGLYQNKIERHVPLGIFADQNNADVSGRSLALAILAGGDLKLGKVTTGPVAGLVLQQVRMNGFTETGTSGVTALMFDSQTRGSIVSQLGWRASVDIGDWQPFAEAKWSHEWADKNRTVTASLTTVPAPPYSMDAVPMAKDWASGSLGVVYKLSSQVMLRGVGSAMFLNRQGTSYGGELGLSYSF